MISVFYPYLQGASKWDELRYSLRSLEMYFRSEFEVVIVGDLPPWVQNVRHIPHRRDEHVSATCTYDALSKLWAFLSCERTSERFIRMYDDIYLLRDLCETDLEVTRYLWDYQELHHGTYTSGGSVWRNQVLQTTKVVRRMGLPGYMTETHCPELFEKEKMLKVFEMFDPVYWRLLSSTLYYNVFPFDTLLKDRKSERALFYGENNQFSFASDPDGFNAIAGKRFLNHNDKGLTPPLMEIIQGLFPHKSRFEK
jgi:hypothetical protein